VRRKRSALTLVKVLVVLAIVGTLLALLLPATRSARPAYERNACQNNLKQIGLALLNYADKHGSLPPVYTTDAEGKPLHSWRTLILPDVEEAELFKKIDLTKPWDDPVNAEAAKTRVPIYECPSSTAESPRTTYLAVIAPNSCLRATEPRRVSDLPESARRAVMVMEVDVNHAVSWMAPTDADEKLFMSAIQSDGTTILDCSTRSSQTDMFKRLLMTCRRKNCER
jgi:type II secretory pathway pseudopilin PulG